jgi:hypothetical protein
VNEFFKILTFILLSSVKFAVGPAYVYLNDSYDFSFFETNLYAIIGGMLGVVVFMYFSEWMLDAWHWIKNYFRKKFKPKQLFSDPVADVEVELDIKYSYVPNEHRNKKLFTKGNRRLVRLWKKYGLAGVAALTPVLFSIPIGTFFMTRVERNNKKILLYMFISVTIWSLILTSLFELFHARNIQDIVQ